MPVCDEKLKFDYIYWICFAFSWITLVETVLVVNLYHRSDKTVSSALTPAIIKLYCRKFKSLVLDLREGKKKLRFRLAAPGSLKDLQIRQILEELFAALDSNYSGALDQTEVKDLIQALPGKTGYAMDTHEILTKFEECDRNRDGTISFEEFAFFCEEHIVPQHPDPGTFEHVVQAYLRTHDRLARAMAKKWQNVAATVDSIARVVLPPGWLWSLWTVYQMSAQDLEDNMATDKQWDQWSLKLRGLLLLLIVGLMFFAAGVTKYGLQRRFDYIDKHGEVTQTDSVRRGGSVDALHPSMACAMFPATVSSGSGEASVAISIDPKEAEDAPTPPPSSGEKAMGVPSAKTQRTGDVPATEMRIKPTQKTGGSVDVPKESQISKPHGSCKEKAASNSSEISRM